MAASQSRGISRIARKGRTNISVRRRKRVKAWKSEVSGGRGVQIKNLEKKLIQTRALARCEGRSSVSLKLGGSKSGRTEVGERRKRGSRQKI